MRRCPCSNPSAAEVAKDVTDSAGRTLLATGIDIDRLSNIDGSENSDAIVID